MDSIPTTLTSAPVSQSRGASTPPVVVAKVRTSLGAPAATARSTHAGFEVDLADVDAGASLDQDVHGLFSLPTVAACRPEGHAGRKSLSRVLEATGEGP